MANRRQFLWLALTGAVMSGVVTGYLRQRGSALETRPLKSVPGYRYLRAGPATGVLADPFIGLDADEARPVGDIRDLFLFEAAPGQVPVACFSDYNCTYCRVLTKMLAQEARHGGIAVSWHELPLLGPSSVEGAKAALAAGMQGAYLPMHARLMRSRFRPNAAYLEQVAGEIGLDGARLLQDMDGATIRGQLEKSAGVARLFGIYGTPALVVGRTLVLGNINQSDLRQLIEIERG